MVESINQQSLNTTASITNTRLNSTTTAEPSVTELSTGTLPNTAVTSPTVNAGTSPAVTLLVSKESQEKATQDLATAKLVRKANAVKEPYDAEKVERFKQLLKDPDALSQYLNNVNTQGIADTLLDSPEGQIFN
jgi:hypothetical protein